MCEDDPKDAERTTIFVRMFEHLSRVMRAIDSSSMVPILEDLNYLARE